MRVLGIVNLVRLCLYNKSPISVAPSNVPTLHTCHTVIIGENGEKKRTTGSACDDLRDFYGNFLPDVVTFDMLAEFSVNTTQSTKPNFIEESNFGVTDAKIEIRKHLISGKFVGVISYVYNWSYNLNKCSYCCQFQ